MFVETRHGEHEVEATGGPLDRPGGGRGTSYANTGISEIFSARAQTGEYEYEYEYGDLQA